MLFSCRKYYKLVMVCEKKRFKNSILIYIRVVIYYIIRQGANACNLVAFCLVYYLPTFFIMYIFTKEQAFDQ